VPESWSDQDLIVAGWARSELDWEEHTLAFATALGEADAEAARAQSGRSLFLAREALAGDDPRLGTALANHALSLSLAADASAGELLGEAAAVWRQSDQWIAAMTAPRVARSSLFHMRMEQRHRPVYEERWRTKWKELAAEARSRVPPGLPLPLPQASRAAAAGDRWRRERPDMLNDTRKLMAATILLLPGV
jgi:hypothetical protein